MPNLQRTPFSRLFTIEDRAGPANAPVYQGFGRAQSPSWDGGDLTSIEAPSEDQYGLFDIIDTIRGAQGLPQLPIQVRYTQDLSEMLRLFRKRCPIDAQVHMGECRNPTDFNGGWHKVAVLEGAILTSYGADELGALVSGEDAVINENIPLTGLNYYEIGRLLPAELGAAEIVQEIVDVEICDSRQCGECGLPSDGCQVVFALTLTAGGSPGLPGELIFSQDGGTTLGETNVTTLGIADDPSAMDCVGTRLIIVSNASCSLHYATIANILAGTEAWVEMAVGFQCPAGAPNAIWSAGALHTFIVGDGGYIYFTADPTASVTVQDAGVVTAQNLAAVHGIDERNVVAVGESNAVVVTENGGETWTLVVGPIPAVDLTAVWMRSELEWFVGDIQGSLWYTRDAGATWTAKAFPGSGAGVVRDIKFSTPTVGYLAHSIVGPAGRILRTIDGGYSWYVLPEATTTFPANDYVSSLAVCEEDPNVVFGGGLADDGTDGFFVKASA